MGSYPVTLVGRSVAFAGFLPGKLSQLYPGFSALTLEKSNMGTRCLIEPDFPHLHLSTREKVTIIGEPRLGDPQLDPRTRGLSRLLGEMPANNNLLRYPQFRRNKFLLANIQFVKIYSPNRFIVIKDF